MKALNRYGFPTRIVSGQGARQEIATHLKAAGFKRPLLVTDRGIAKLPLLKSILDLLQEAGLKTSVYSEIFGNPTVSQLKGGTEAFKNALADCIVAFGGGAAMDVAKGIAIMANHSGSILDYCGAKPKAIEDKIPYIITVPTTAGTGSEVGRAGVVSDDRTHQKFIFFSPYLMPKFVVLDPELTKDLPASVTASTGMDALTHLVEAFIAQGENPLTDGVALEGIHWLAGSLVTAVKEPHNLEARHRMQNAAMMGAVAFQKGLGVTHSLAHSLSTVCDLHHGLANGIMITYAMEFNLSHCRHQFARMAQAAGRPAEAEAFIAWLKELRAEIGIPDKLSGAGVDASKLDELVKFAYADGCHLENPKPVSERDLRQMYQQALT